MSENLPPPPPMSPLPYYGLPPRPRLRPLSVSVLAWIAIVLGALGAVGPMCVIGAQMVPQPQNVVQQAMQNDPAIHIVNLAGQIVAFFAGIYLIFTGMFCLQLKPIGRRMFLWYAWYQVVMFVFSMIYTPFVLLPHMHAIWTNNPGDMAARAGYYGAVGGFIFGVLVAIATIIVIFYFLNRPHVKAAFKVPGFAPPAVEGSNS